MGGLLRTIGEFHARTTLSLSKSPCNLFCGLHDANQYAETLHGTRALPRTLRVSEQKIFRTSPMDANVMKQSSFRMSLVKAILDDLERGPVLSHDNRCQLMDELKQFPNRLPFTGPTEPPPRPRGRGRPSRGDAKTWLWDMIEDQHREIAAEYYISLCEHGGRGSSARAVHETRSWYNNMYGEYISETIIKTTASKLKEAGIIARPPAYFELELAALDGHSSLSEDEVALLKEFRHPSNESSEVIPLEQEKANEEVEGEEGEEEGESEDGNEREIAYSEFCRTTELHAANVAEQAAREIGEGLTSYLNDHVLTPDRTRWMSDEEREEFRARFLNEFVLQLFRKLANAAPSAPP